MEKEQILKSETKPGVCFTVNENGGMGGACYEVFSYGSLCDIEKDENTGFLKVTSVKGEKLLINPAWCSSISEEEIIINTVNVFQWNGGFLDKCKYEDIGNIIERIMSKGKELHQKKVASI